MPSPGTSQPWKGTVRRPPGESFKVKVPVKLPVDGVMAQVTLPGLSVLAKVGIVSVLVLPMRKFTSGWVTELLSRNDAVKSLAKLGEGRQCKEGGAFWA